MKTYSTIVPVILCGGSGTRLWPLSRKLYPKQFVKMGHSQTLFSQTLQRAITVGGNTRPLIISNEDYRFYLLENLDQLNIDAEIILEPVAKNTAPALALAVLSIMDKADALMLVLPSDHFFENDADFCETIAKAAPVASAGHIVTFGIKPSRPEQGYGYIHRGEDLPNNAFSVSRFVEKPDADSAKQMLDAGEYFWNSGIFLMSASVYIEELVKFVPEILKACQKAWRNRNKDDRFLRPDSDAFMASPENSIDYAIMEKTYRIAMLPLYCGYIMIWVHGIRFFRLIEDFIARHK